MRPIEAPAKSFVSIARIAAIDGRRQAACHPKSRSVVNRLLSSTHIGVCDGGYPQPPRLAPESNGQAIAAERIVLTRLDYDGGRNGDGRGGTADSQEDIRWVVDPRAANPAIVLPWSLASLLSIVKPISAAACPAGQPSKLDDGACADSSVAGREAGGYRRSGARAAR
jgi:hypothetical protein